MNIIAHRGYWKEPGEKNSLDAITRAFKYGYGIETDIRDYKGKLVISHDIANAGCPELEDILLSYISHGCNKMLALNVKADGIQPLLKPLLDKLGITNYFLFDMSIPELVVNHVEKLNYYTRQSDIESECVMYKSAKGVWLDSFFDERWLTSDIICRHIAAGKEVCIVSPELHGYAYETVWKMIKETEDVFSSEQVTLCTDVPEIASKYFGGE